jgi:hypothetical protein
MNEPTSFVTFLGFYSSACVLGVLIGYRLGKMKRYNLESRNTFITKI